MLKTISVSFTARTFCVAFLIYFAALNSGRAQLSPGPHEMLPYEEGFIVEGFKDLETNTVNAIADWTGWSGTVGPIFVVSPDAYDDHGGTDVSVQTGTRLYATCVGTVAEV